MSSRSLLTFLASSALVSCTDGTGKTPGSGSDDTGDTGTTVTYEEGCIMIDGDGGYAWLSDALTMADEGATIELCDGSLEESVVIDKTVAIVGPGPDEFTLVGNTNEPTITIQAANVSISGITVESTRSGIDIEEASGISLSDLRFESVDNYGINADDSEDLLVEACTFEGTGYGGVKVDGGSATVQDSTFSGNTGYGLLATGGASLTLTGSTISSTSYDSKGSNGVGVMLEDGSVGTLAGNVLTDNYLIGVYADSSDLSLDGESISGSYYGIAAVLGELTATGLTLTDNILYGLYGFATEGTNLTGITVTGDPEVVTEVASDDWGSEDYGYASTGLFVVTDDLYLSDSTVTGYNNAGILLGEYDSGTLEVDTVTVADSGRKGIYLSGGDYTMT
ncbi:MAG: right-handed parallel beta-helix repeat-containing protein, partial [Myxococcota bacterium]|nr:right-handed parallel beta-helix repeat-containing protein [Myxococcota bacterium]